MSEKKPTAAQAPAGAGQASREVVLSFSPDYREVFIDGAVQATTRDGIIRLDLSADRYRPGKVDQVERMIVSRLVMSPATMAQLHRALTDVMGRLRKAGPGQQAPGQPAPGRQAPGNQPPGNQPTSNQASAAARKVVIDATGGKSGQTPPE